MNLFFFKEKTSFVTGPSLDIKTYKSISKYMIVLVYACSDAVSIQSF